MTETAGFDSKAHARNLYYVQRRSSLTIDDLYPPCTKRIFFQSYHSYLDVYFVEQI